MQRLPERLAHHVARAVRPDPPDLGRDEAEVFERLFGDVVPELLPCPSSRAPRRFPSPDSGPRRAGRGSAPAAAARTACGAEQLRVTGDDLGADLFRIAVGGQVGAREEHLPAAGGDRHEPVAAPTALRIVQGATTSDHAGERGSPRRTNPERQSAALAARTRSLRGPRRRPGTRDGPGQALRAARPDAATARAGHGPGGAVPSGAPRTSPAPLRTAASPRAARPSASPGTRAGRGRSRPRRAPISARRACGPGEQRGARSGR